MILSGFTPTWHLSDRHPTVFALHSTKTVWYQLGGCHTAQRFLVLPSGDLYVRVRAGRCRGDGNSGELSQLFDVVRAPLLGRTTCRGLGGGRTRNEWDQVGVGLLLGSSGRFREDSVKELFMNND